MIPRSHGRPASITAFAVLFFAAALIAFLEGLVNIPNRQFYLQAIYSAIDWSRDAVIVWQSAWLSIALIPIAMVWVSAVRLARWMVAIMAIPKLLGLLTVGHIGVAGADPISLAWLLSSLMGLLAAALLFTPASNRWFARDGEDDPAVFE